MTDQHVEGVAAAGSDQRLGWPGRLAWAITELFAPQHVALALPLVAGVLAEGWPGLAWGVLTALLCAGVPAVVIAIGVRRGRLDSKHLVQRSGRKVPMLAGLVAVVGGLALLIALDASRVAIATAAVMLGWVLVMGLITVWWKISFHTGVFAGASVVVAAVTHWEPVLLACGLIVVGIGWARVRIAHHTLAQVVAGVVVGSAVAWAATWLVLS
ncbi:hypothetical protein [Nonomuraea dietziae]|uniref:Phosphatidic acid phosphatase type 2/haloperoxidase domain-containing protein n=1 Tax=Nonomuraea dietziae TaxID=65515 RepID=A0A7W5UY94_9ACTN|nr:hypothetical protein [Nonomuraea dietziae]MBB3725219.1 hypothetical protein [Nonomuraea dietziae]